MRRLAHSTLRLGSESSIAYAKLMGPDSNRDAGGMVIPGVIGIHDSKPSIAVRTSA
jgi:hypothetical protein